MRLAISALISWFIVSAIFMAAFQWDGIDFAITDLPNMVPLLFLTSGAVAIYMIVFGGLGLAVFIKLRLRKKTHFFIIGLLCTAPLLLGTLFGQEFEWFIATLISGTIASGIIALFGSPKDVT